MAWPERRTASASRAAMAFMAGSPSSPNPPTSTLTHLRGSDIGLTTRLASVWIDSTSGALSSSALPGRPVRATAIASGPSFTSTATSAPIFWSSVSTKARACVDLLGGVARRRLSDLVVHAPLRAVWLDGGRLRLLAGASFMTTLFTNCCWTIENRLLTKM